jgi:hypothetical protein
VPGGVLDGCKRLTEVEQHGDEGVAQPVRVHRADFLVGR